MLIDFISSSFQNVHLSCKCSCSIQGSPSFSSQDIECKFARAVIIREIKKAPPIPVPMNVILFLASQYLITAVANALTVKVTTCSFYD